MTAAPWGTFAGVMGIELGNQTSKQAFPDREISKAKRPGEILLPG